MENNTLFAQMNTFVKETWNNLVGKKEITFAYTWHILIVFLLLTGIASGYVGYRWYQISCERAAQLTFGLIVDDFNKALEDAKEEEQDKDFSDIAQAFADGYQKHKDSALAPYFLSFQADALLQNDNRDKALEAMDGAIDTLSSSTAFSSLFKVKRALLALDSVDDIRKQNGLDELQTIANDTHNTYRDYALYQVGLYHWVHDDVDQARVAWKTLVDVYKDDLEAPSPWVDIVSEKLKTVA